MAVESKPRNRRRILSPAERRQRNRDEMTAAILDVAREIMREHGVGALNLNEVARRVGVTTPALYSYFPNKMAVYDALFRLGTSEFRAAMERIHKAHEPGWARIRAWIEAWIQAAQERPELYLLCFERPVPGFVPSEESMGVSRAFLQSGRRAFEECIESDDVQPDVPVSRAFDLFIALRHGLATQHLANEPHLPAGSGRFGSLVDDSVALLQARWSRPLNQAKVSEIGPQKGKE